MVLLGGAFAALATATFLVLVALPTQGGAHEVALQGVDEAELAGWGRLLEPDGRDASVSAPAAVAAASSNKASARVLETVLVRLVNESAKPRLDRLAWAVNFDPESVDAAPLIGPAGADLPRTCGSHPEYDVVFIDAQTGDLMFEIQHALTLPDGDPAATCPPEPGYPQPTQVPGQE
jgi:hypothetical protein